jgi:hypothetical protein
MPLCWKSAHSCARRITGCATWPASLLKAMSCPTESWPSITSRAPVYIVATVTSLDTSVTPPCASELAVAVRKLDAT